MQRVTNAQVYAALARLHDHVAQRTAHLDTTLRSPSDQREEERAVRIGQAKYNSCWNAQQGVENYDRQAEGPAKLVAALKDVREHLTEEIGRAKTQLNVVRGDWSSMAIGERALIQDVEGFTAMIRIIEDGGPIPSELAQRLVRRGITPPEGHAA